MKALFKIKNILLLAVVVQFLSGCTERINLDLDDSTIRLVVEGTLTTDVTEHTVRLTTTTSYYYTQAPPPVSGARVSIFDGEHTIELHETEPGVYKTDADVFGVPNTTYTLNIELAEEIGGFKTYTAQSTLSPAIKVDSVALDYQPKLGSKGLWFIKAKWTSRPGDDFYRFLTYRNGKLLSDSLTKWLTSDDLYEPDTIFTIVDVLSLEEEVNRLNPYDTVTIELDIIDKSFMTFIQDAQSESFGSNPLFSGPPANVKGNISNGAIGYFSAYSYSRCSTLVPEFEEGKKAVRKKK